MHLLSYLSIIIDIMIFLGSALMIFNIIRYYGFTRQMAWMGKSIKNSLALYIPLYLLIFFLAGYLMLGIAGNPDLVMAGILLGGSVFVSIILGLLYFIVGRVKSNETQLSAMYGELMNSIDRLTEGSLSVFRVNLTKDIIEERAGSDLFDSDYLAESYTDLMDGRCSCIMPEYVDGKTKRLFSRDGLLEQFHNGQRTCSQVVFCRRKNAGECFVRWQASLAVQPSTGDVVAFITERECNDEMVTQTILHKALIEQYDMITYIVNGQYDIVIGDEEGHTRGNLFPRENKGDYNKFITEQIVPFLSGTQEEKKEAGESLLLDKVEKELSYGEPYQVNISCELDGEKYYKRFVLFNVDGAAGFYILLESDITQIHKEQIRQNTQLKEALDAARQASQAKTTFLSNMSHDIRTPMNAVIGYTQLARREGTTVEKMREYIEKIDASSQHLLTLINDVLEMSRIENGKIDLEPVSTDLAAVLDELKDIFSSQMEEKNITFSVEAVQLTDRMVLCDKKRLNRVLLNLISNAYKFTPEGGAVSVTLHQTASSATSASFKFHVKDNGIGMSEDFAKRIFESFERERTSTVSGIQGTGLGMAITRQFVDMMGGNIGLITSPGKGSEFIISLTFPPLEENEFNQTDGAEEVNDNDRLSREGTRGNLLLVEDNPVNMEIASLILTDAGYVLDQAENGQQAVDIVAASAPGQYDAILMDIQMPVMDGYEATRRIRALKDPALAKIPIIAMTANAFREDIQMAEDAGMNAHISKPLNVPDMMKCLTDVLSE